MRKLMLLAAMLAMVLVAAAPAFGQATAVQYDDGSSDDDVNTAICTNIIEEIDAGQVQYGDANAASVEGDAAADIAQKLGITITQVNNCFNTYILTGAPGPNGTPDPNAPKPVEPGGGPGNNEPSGGNGPSSGNGPSDGSGSSGDNDKAPGGVSILPDTGGASLFTLGAGALLVGGGLLARRIFG